MLTSVQPDLAGLLIFSSSFTYLSLFSPTIVMGPVLLHAREAHMESVGMILAWAGAAVGSLLLILLVVWLLARRHQRRHQELPDFLEVEVNRTHRECSCLDMLMEERD
jgi:Flp pilus assembly protein TadB